MNADDALNPNIGQTPGSPSKWDSSMLSHHVPGLPVDPHSIEEAENIIESFLMQASFLLWVSGSLLPVI